MEIERERKQVRITFPLVSGLWLLALVISGGTTLFAWRAALWTVTADAWGFTATFLGRYFDGRLGWTDFFVKRGEGDHAQPVQKLLLLLNALVFDMDFTIEAMIGLLFGASLVAVIAWLVRSDTGSQPRAAIANGLAVLGLAAIVFTVNDPGVFNWSLATLSFLYPLGVALLLVLAHRCITRERPLLLGVGIFCACVLLDTSAILAAAAVGALVVRHGVTTQAWRPGAKCLAAVVAAAVVYGAGYSLAIPTGGIDEPLSERMAYLALHAREAWQAFVVPFGAVVLSPSRIRGMYGVGALWHWLIATAVLLWIGHVWFWREFLRRRDERVAFVAAGLMLFFYATIAGIVWGRVPRFGFDYLMQARYLVFYQLQLVAMLMLAATRAARSVSPLPLGALAAGVAVATLLSLYFLYGIRIVVPAQIAVGHRLADDIVKLADDPAHVPAGCSSELIAPCGWPPSGRTPVLELLRRERLNAFSPAVRARHGLPPLDAGAASP